MPFQKTPKLTLHVRPCYVDYSDLRKIFHTKSVWPYAQSNMLGRQI
jgi:hypothetical protein